jgi:hypothetical protein
MAFVEQHNSTAGILLKSRYFIRLHHNVYALKDVRVLFDRAKYTAMLDYLRNEGLDTRFKPAFYGQDMFAIRFPEFTIAIPHTVEAMRLSVENKEYLQGLFNIHYAPGDFTYLLSDSFFSNMEQDLKELESKEVH